LSAKTVQKDAKRNAKTMQIDNSKNVRLVEGVGQIVGGICLIAVGIPAIRWGLPGALVAAFVVVPAWLWWSEWSKRKIEIWTLQEYATRLDHLIEVAEHPGDNQRIFALCEQHIVLLRKSDNRHNVRVVPIYFGGVMDGKSYQGETWEEYMERARLWHVRLSRARHEEIHNSNKQGPAYWENYYVNPQGFEKLRAT
jgi:hypothetical protein